MEEMVESIACNDVSKFPKVIANEVLEIFKVKYEGRAWKFHTVEFMIAFIYRCRHKSFSDWEGLITSPPLSLCGDQRLFLQFNLTANIDNNLERIIGWAHPSLIFELRGRPQRLFIDCSFSMCPHDFYQVMVIMVYLDQYDEYVPVFYILLQSKRENAYVHAIQGVVSATNWELQALTYTCDFELALAKVCRMQFKDGVPILCNFHFKQALRKKLLDLGVDKVVVSSFIGAEGPINILSLIPIEEIEEYGIPFIRSVFNEGQYTVQFNLFWKYFGAVWIKRYPPNLWNINGYRRVEDEEGIIINRTNNPLERFNRKLGDHLGNHPTMARFVAGISEISNEYVSKLENIKKEYSKPKAGRHKPARVEQVCKEYFDFLANEKKKKEMLNVKKNLEELLIDGCSVI